MTPDEIEEELARIERAMHEAKLDRQRQVARDRSFLRWMILSLGACFLIGIGLAVVAAIYGKPGPPDPQAEYWLGVLTGMAIHQ